MARGEVSNWEHSPKLGSMLLNRSTDFVVNKEKKLVVVRFSKKVTAEDIGRYASRLGNHPDFQSTFSEIADLREVEEMDLEAEDFLKLADEVDPFSPGAKRAFVARTSTQKHAARMHKILRANRHFEIFESFAEAERWVDG